MVTLPYGLVEQPSVDGIAQPLRIGFGKDLRLLGTAASAYWRGGDRHNQGEDGKTTLHVRGSMNEFLLQATIEPCVSALVVRAFERE